MKSIRFSIFSGALACWVERHYYNFYVSIITLIKFIMSMVIIKNFFILKILIKIIIIIIFLFFQFILFIFIYFLLHIIFQQINNNNNNNTKNNIKTRIFDFFIIPQMIFTGRLQERRTYASYIPHTEASTFYIIDLIILLTPDKRRIEKTKNFMEKKNHLIQKIE